MSRAPYGLLRPVATAVPGALPVVPPRPTGLDYLFILCGCALSRFLTELSGLRAIVGENLSTGLGPPLIATLPFLLLLPVGIVLLWPLFHATQRLLGRPPGLTVGEWLWGVAWLLAVALTSWIVWNYAGSPPEILGSDSFKRSLVVGYALSVLSLGAVALMLTLVDLVGRWTQPWTHRFGLVLLIWPALPLAALWALDIQIAFINSAPPSLP
jgi:hypothetical protein